MVAPLPIQSVTVRRSYYLSGTPIPPVFYDDLTDAQPNTPVLDTVLAYDGSLNVVGYYWNGIQQVPNSGGNPPQFVSAEIGTVNGYTVAVTFDTECVTPPVVEIKVNTVVTTDDGGTVQGDAHVVHYVIPIPWHGADDTVTVDDNVVTNNIAWGALLDLQADTLALGAVSTWADQSTNGHDFTQTGDARPVAQDVGGKRAVTFDGVDDWMLGEDFADNLNNFAVILIHQSEFIPDRDNPITKIDDDSLGVGWGCNFSGIYGISIAQDFSNYIFPNYNGSLLANTWYIYAWEKLGNVFHNHYNNSVADDSIVSAGTVTTFSTIEPVRLGVGKFQGEGATFANMKLRAILILQITDVDNWPIDRDVIVARLADRYGVVI